MTQEQITQLPTQEEIAAFAPKLKAWRDSLPEHERIHVDALLTMALREEDDMQGYGLFSQLGDPNAWRRVNLTSGSAWRRGWQEFAAYW